MRTHRLPPGIHVLFLFGPSLIHSQMSGYSPAAMDAYHPPQGVDYSSAGIALLAPFFNGVLEAADDESEIVDICELSYYFETEDEFA